MNYDRDDIIRRINVLKAIHTFRLFYESLNYELRQDCIQLGREFLMNEYKYAVSPEKERVLNLLTHWQYTALTAASWWRNLAMNHSRCTSLLTLLRLWIA